MRRTRVGVGVAIGVIAVVIAWWYGRSTNRAAPPEQSQSRVPLPAVPRNVAPQIAKPKAKRPVGALRLEGQVIDDRNQPVEGATVTLYHDDPTLGETATTAADGAFVFENLPEQTVRVSAAKGDRLASRSAEIYLKRQIEPVVLQLWPATAMRFHIVDGDTHEPLVGATIAARSSISGDDSGVSRASSDKDGIATVHRLFPGGAVIAWVRGTPYETTLVRSMMAVDPMVANDVTVELHRCALVSGFLRTASGAPEFPGGISYASGPNGGDVAETDATGAFHFDCLAAGRHIFYPSRGAAVTVELDGRPRTGLVLTVPDQKISELHGIVVDDHGAPREGVNVHAHAYKPFTFDHVKTDREGRFTVKLALVDRQDASFDCDNDEVVLDQTMIVRAADRAREIQLRVHTPPRTSGIVVDRKGKPVPGAQVHTADGWYPADVTDRDGHFTLAATRAGDLKLVAEVKDVIGASDPAWAVVHSGQQDVKLVLADVATVTGRVVLRGAPVTSFEIDLGDRVQRSFRSADGSFEIDRVGRNKWTFKIGGPGFQPKEIPVATAGHDIDLGTIAVDEGQTVRGRVIDQRGAPVTSATVSVEQHLPYGFETPFDKVVAGTPTTVSDVTGQFTLSGIAPSATNRIVARHPKLGSSAYVVLDERATTVDLVITSTGSIEGEVDAHVAYYVKMTRADDPSFEMHCPIDHVNRYRCEQLVPGDYLLAPEGIVLAQVHVSVHAEELLHLDLTLPVSVTLGVDNDCKRLVLESNASDRAVLQQTSCAYHLVGVPPGSYQLCADDKCMPIVVTATPAMQSFHLP